MIRNLSKRERYIFISVVIVVILAIFYNFILEPVFRKRRSLNNEIIITKARIRKSLKLLETQNTIINEYNAFTSNLTNISKILSYIEKEALLLEIKTANIRPRPVIKKEYYEEYIIELQIEGEFSNINKFISQLIKPPLFVTVKKLDLRRAAETSPYLKGTVILSKLII
ncbi:MAG: type 4a pilus biogenesis protein PilO [Candidatus Omnitrophica bacterium]|nr:type 4a pilus biogenesis protein PilO [Candidatus Omnitrophota bacterium]